MSNTDLTTQSTELAEALADLDFGEFQVPYVPSLKFPVVQYMKGVEVVDGVDTIDFTGYCIHTGQDPELDALFKQLSIPCVKIRHRRGSEELYWQFETLKGAILCKSVPTVGDYGVSNETGVPYVWNKYTYKDEKGNDAVCGSQLQVLFFLNGLMELGYTRPLVLTLSRTVTKYLVTNVIQRQSGVIELIKTVLRKQSRPNNLSMYALWLELAVGKQKTPKKDGGYLPPVAIIPSPLTSEYVHEHKVPDAHKEIIESFVPSLDAWVSATVTRLMAPRDDETQNIEEINGTHVANVDSVSNAVVQLHSEVPEGYVIPATDKMIREAVVKNLHKCIDAGLVNNPKGWQAVLDTLGIAKFTERTQIVKLNQYIVSRLNKVS